MYMYVYIYIYIYIERESINYRAARGRSGGSLGRPSAPAPGNTIIVSYM